MWVFDLFEWNKQCENLILDSASLTLYRLLIENKMTDIEKHLLGAMKPQVLSCFRFLTSWSTSSLIACAHVAALVLGST